MKSNFKTMFVHLTVLSICAETYSAKVKVGIQQTPDGKVEESVLENVFASGLVKYKFANDKRFVIGKTYVSQNNSTNYLENPLKIIRGCNTETGKLTFGLFLVNQSGSNVYEFHTPKGNVVKSRVFKSVASHKWLRYMDFYAKNKAIYDVNRKAMVEAQ